MNANTIRVAGVDVGTECVKAIVLDGDRAILGRSVVPTRGAFDACTEEAIRAVLAEAGTNRADLDLVYATGFGARCVPDAARSVSDSLCHALGAAWYVPDRATVIDIGGRNPSVIRITGGAPREIYTVRRCASGIGTFLMFAARHLDVHPTRLEEVAAGAEKPAAIGSYCSVFAGTEILERLLEGATPAEVALGCIHSIAERIYEIGELVEPVLVTGGVAEYFPGVLRELSALAGVRVDMVPEPIMAGALGAAAQALDAATAGAAA